MLRPHIFVCLCLPMMLASCAHQGRITPPPNVLAHQEILQSIAHWQLQGKLGIRTIDNSGSVSVKWKQEQQNYQINLSAPLGQKHIVITGKPDLVTLEEAGQPTLTAKNAEVLIKKAAGWTLPVAQLAYWVRGVPAPHDKITHLETNGLGLISTLRQSDWIITYSNYHNWPFSEQELTLPQKIVAEYRDIRLTLIIRDWQMAIN